MPSDQFPLAICYGDGADIFCDKRKNIDDIKQNCIVFLDTNVLLAPYNLNDKSLDQIAQTYELIAKQNRLYIPAQVAAEFAKNRASKVGGILKTVNDQNSKLQSPLSKQYTILKALPKYQLALELVGQIEGKNRELGKLLKEVSEEIRTWGDTDPVLDMYKSVLAGRTIDLSDKEKEKISEEINYRYRHNIPPGFKDDTKTDGGAGDLIIWKTILETCKSQSKDAIFVTLDQKPDWWSQASGGPLFPRSELVHEFGRMTGGKSIHLQLFSNFLSSFGVDKIVVDHVKDFEETKAEESIDDEEMNELEHYDLPKVTVRYLALQEEAGKVSEQIKGRVFAYKRCRDRGDLEKAEYHRTVIKELRRIQHLNKQQIAKIAAKYPIILSDDSFIEDEIGYL